MKTFAINNFKTHGFIVGEDQYCVTLYHETRGVRLFKNSIQVCAFYSNGKLSKKMAVRLIEQYLNTKETQRRKL